MKKGKVASLQYLLVTKPIHDMPFIWIVLTVLFIFSVAAISMNFDAVARGIPLKSDLNLTQGTLEKVYDNRRGVYISVVDDRDGSRIYFPRRGGYAITNSPIHEWVWKSVGESIEVLWRRPLSLSGLILGDKEIWALQISGRNVSSYEGLRQRRGESLQSRIRAFWISAILVTVIPLGVGISSYVRKQRN